MIHGHITPWYVHNLSFVFPHGFIWRIAFRLGCIIKWFKGSLLPLKEVYCLGLFSFYEIASQKGKVLSMDEYLSCFYWNAFTATDHHESLVLTMLESATLVFLPFLFALLWTPWQSFAINSCAWRAQAIREDLILNSMDANDNPLPKK